MSDREPTPSRADGGPAVPRVPLEAACRQAFGEVIARRPGDAARLDAMIAAVLAPTAAPAQAGAIVRAGPVLVGVALGSALAWGLGHHATGSVAPIARVAPQLDAAPADDAAPRLDAAPARVHQDSLAPHDPRASHDPRAPHDPLLAEAPARATRPAAVNDATPTSAMNDGPTASARESSRSRERSPERPRPAASVVPASASELLERANAARRRAEFARADEIYAELEREHPGSREANVGRVSHGRLLLDQLGRPDAAAVAFATYLAENPTGNLAAEARVGRARALDAAGRPDEAREAWLDLLRAHPNSIHADRARRALAE